MPFILKSLENYTILTAILVVFTIITSSAFAQHFEFETTDIYSSVMVRNLTLTDRHPAAGDELGIFTPDGLCGGSEVVEEIPIGLAAWGDDDLTDEIDGFRNGESYNYRFWDASREEEIILTSVSLLLGSNNWSANGFAVLELSDQGRHFVPTPTHDRHHFICNNIEIIEDAGRRSAADLDQVGIYTPDGTIAGIIVWNSEAGFAEGWAYRDNPATEEIEGFLAGEPFEFRFWEASTDWETAAVLTVTDGDTVFHPETGESTIELQCFNLPVHHNGLYQQDFHLIELYPNPFNSNLNISLKLSEKSLIKVDIFNMLGRKIYSSSEMFASPGEQNIRIRFDGLSTGAYLCNVSTDKSRTSALISFVK